MLFFSGVEPNFSLPACSDKGAVAAAAAYGGDERHANSENRRGLGRQRNLPGLWQPIRGQLCHEYIRKTAHEPNCVSMRLMRNHEFFDARKTPESYRDECVKEEHEQKLHMSTRTENDFSYSCRSRENHCDHLPHPRFSRPRRPLVGRFWYAPPERRSPALLVPNIADARLAGGQARAFDTERTGGGMPQLGRGRSE